MRVLRSWLTLGDVVALLAMVGLLVFFLFMTQAGL